jgi:hypothetical protein
MWSNQKLNCEEAMEKDVSPFGAHPVLHYSKTLEKRNNWAIPFDFHIVGHNALFNFASSSIRFKTTVIIGAWQNPIIQPTFPSPIVDNPNVIRGPHASNPIA